MSDCRFCSHNSYKNISKDWISCSHPVTLTKTPRWEKGDPAWVNMMTADVPVTQIENLADCPTFEAAK